MRLGVFSNTISGSSPEEVAECSRAAGVEAVQLRLEWLGLDVEGRAADRVRVRRAYEAAGIEVAAVAAYTNLFDLAVREQRRGRQPPTSVPHLAGSHRRDYPASCRRGTIRCPGAASAAGNRRRQAPTTSPTTADRSASRVR